LLALQLNFCFCKMKEGYSTTTIFIIVVLGVNLLLQVLSYIEMHKKFSLIMSGLYVLAIAFHLILPTLFRKKEEIIFDFEKEKQDELETKTS